MTPFGGTLAQAVRALVIAAAFTAAAATAFAQSYQISGYLGWWMPESWRQLPLQDMDRLMFFELEVQPDGQVTERRGWPQDWHALIQASVATGLPIDLTLTLFNPQLFNKLFESDASTAQFLRTCADLTEGSEASGIQLDFEFDGNEVSAQALDGFRGFLQALAQQFKNHKPAKTLSAFFQPLSKTNLYDADSLALMDYVAVQGYDVHHRQSTEAGPIAPLKGTDVLTWESALTKSLNAGLKNSQIYFTFPLYGYEWPVKSAQPRSKTRGAAAITSFAPISEYRLPEIQVSVMQRVQSYGATTDPASGSSFYTFKSSNGQWMQGWFEDWWSLSQKLTFITQQQTAGVAFFLLGYDRSYLIQQAIAQRGPRSLENVIQRWTENP
jgi:spore germination protein YaaH